MVPMQTLISCMVLVGVRVECIGLVVITEKGNTLCQNALSYDGAFRKDFMFCHRYYVQATVGPVRHTIMDAVYVDDAFVSSQISDTRYVR
jgi:hypothetical protein